jgi:hypothetical protein
MYMQQAQEKALKDLVSQGVLNEQESSDVEQYFTLKENDLGVGPALYRNLEDIITKYSSDQP